MLEDSPTPGVIVSSTCIMTVDDDASPEVLETMEAAAYIHVDDTVTPGVGLSSNRKSHRKSPPISKTARKSG